MAGHIRMKGELLFPDFKWVKVTILEQTSFRGNFGTKETWDGGEFTYSKFTLSSSWRGIGGHYKTKFFVLGNRRAIDLGANHCTIPVEQWAKLKKTVEAYNKRFAE